MVFHLHHVNFVQELQEKMWLCQLFFCNETKDFINRQNLKLAFIDHEKQDIA